MTVDLNGFTLLGPGSGAGVAVAGTHTNIAIRGGTIRGWGSGIAGFPAESSVFEGLRISHNTGTGLRVGNYARIHGCTAVTNGGHGIQAATGAHISDCVVALNGFRGIEALDGSNVRNCVTRRNRTEGIFAQSGGVVVNCVSEYNGADGISIDRGLVKDCTVSWNFADGIDASVNCRIIGNVCLNNGNGGDGAGINSSLGGHRIEGNQVSENDRGIDCNPSTGNLVIRNSARSNFTNYDVVAGNTLGPIVTSATIGTSSNPHANYSY